MIQRDVGELRPPCDVADGKRMPEIKQEDVFVKKGKERLPVTEWVPAQGARAGLELFILIDDASDIQLDWLVGASRIGLTAGASAPPAVVSEIVSALSGLGPVSVTERVTTTESIRFGLPKEVRQS